MKLLLELLQEGVELYGETNEDESRADVARLVIFNALWLAVEFDATECDRNLEILETIVEPAIERTRELYGDSGNSSMFDCADR